MVLDKLNLIEDRFEQSFSAMVHLPYLQPFSDINKRPPPAPGRQPAPVSRRPVPLTFLDAPEAAYSHATLDMYELTRVELPHDLFVWALAGRPKQPLRKRTI